MVVVIGLPLGGAGSCQEGFHAGLIKVIRAGSDDRQWFSRNVRNHSISYLNIIENVNIDSYYLMLYV